MSKMPVRDNRRVFYKSTDLGMITCASYTAGTTTSQLSVISSTNKQAPPCMIVVFLRSNSITYHCDGLTDIDDIIAKYTATEAGKEAFLQAKQELNEELRQEVLSGKLNKVKYYRLISTMDQRTLSKRTGIKQSNISRVERLGYRADVETYKKIAEVFNIDYKELLP